MFHSLFHRADPPALIALYSVPKLIPSGDIRGVTQGDSLVTHPGYESALALPKVTEHPYVLALFQGHLNSLQPARLQLRLLTVPSCDCLRSTSFRRMAHGLTSPNGPQTLSGGQSA
jgi:hypothetical protein